MNNTDNDKNTESGAPASGPVPQLQENNSIDGNNLTSANSKVDSKDENLKMGSNNAPNSFIPNEGGVSAQGQAPIMVPIPMPYQAPTQNLQNTQSEKLAENGTNGEGDDKNMEDQNEQQEQQNEVQDVQPDSNLQEKPQEAEDEKKMDDGLANMDDTNQQNTTNKNPPTNENAQVEQQQPTPAAIEEEGEDLKNQGEDDNGRSTKKYGRRNLRERKPRAARNGDTIKNCHICGKNSLRCTLIPCTKGADDCDTNFCNICIRKFNRSLTEDDYYVGIECPVCQSICSCEECKKSVLEEDFKRINELLNRSNSQELGKPNNEDQIMENDDVGHSDVLLNKKSISTDVQMREVQQRQAQENVNYPPLYRSNAALSDENQEAAQGGDGDDESFNENNKSYGQSNRNDKSGPKKSKRGRKKKIRDPEEHSTDSDSDVFNYDKFLKKVSKKGTRVHMNVRMFAVRSAVPGLKMAPVSNPKMTYTQSMDKKMAEQDNQEDRKVSATEQYQTADTQKPPRPRTIGQPKTKFIEPDEASKALIEQVKTMDGYYDPDGYDVGRYNLRKRASQKKYYDEDPDLDEELGIETNQRPGYNLDTQKAGRNQGYAMNPNIPRRSAAQNDEKYQNKPKRKKKRDDDEDYVEEDDEEYEENEEYSANTKLKNMKMGNAQYGYMGSQQPHQSNMSGGMPNNFPMQNQFGMHNPMMQQNPMMMGGRPMPHMMNMQNKFPGQMPNSMQGSMPTNMANKGGMPMNSNAIAYMMNNQNKMGMQNDMSKMPKFPQGNQPSNVPNQNMGFMMGGMPTMFGGFTGMPQGMPQGMNRMQPGMPNFNQMPRSMMGGGNPGQNMGGQPNTNNMYYGQSNSMMPGMNNGMGRPFPQ